MVAESTYLAAFATIGAVVFAAVWFWVGRRTADTPEDIVERSLQEPREVGHEVGIPRPDVREGSWGLFGAVWRAYKHHVRRRKLASKGYVQWFLVDGRWPEPRYVQPEYRDGSKTPEVKVGDEIYQFPREAGAVDAATGMWTFLHLEGEAEAVNIRDPDREVLDAKELNELEQMKTTTEPPSWLNGLTDSLTPQKMLYGAIAAVLVISVVQGGF